MLLLVLSVVTWRTSNVYAGGFDLVVAAKAAVGCLALAAAWAARVNTRRALPMTNTYVWLVLAYITISAFGSWTDGGLAVSGVLAARLILVTATVVMLVKTFPARQVLEDLLSCFALIAVVAATSGLPTLFAQGRLRGGFPQVHSNELSLLCALPLVGLIYLVLRHQARPLHLGLIAVLGAALMATGSRTAVLTVVIAALLMLAQARRLSPFLTTSLLLTVPLFFWLLLGTDALGSFFVRDGPGEGDIATLNSRSIVWAASLEYAQTSWTRWMGSGLAVKRIPVEGQYWDTQNLDSSWVSSLVQAGWLGLALLAVWVLTLALQTTQLPAHTRMGVQALLAALISRSILESGLIDGSPAFLAFMTISLLTSSLKRIPHENKTDGAEKGARRDLLGHNGRPTKPRARPQAAPSGASRSPYQDLRTAQPGGDDHESPEHASPQASPLRRTDRARRRQMPRLT